MTHVTNKQPTRPDLDAIEQMLNGEWDWECEDEFDRKVTVLLAYTRALEAAAKAVCDALDDEKEIDALRALLREP